MGHKFGPNNNLPTLNVNLLDGLQRLHCKMGEWYKRCSKGYVKHV